MSISTTHSAARAAIVTAIRGITPTYEHYQGACWNIVQSRDDVASQDLRNYFVELGMPIPEGEIYGGCELHTCDLMVYTSYGGLSPVDQQLVAAQDQQDLWDALHSANIPGVPKFDKGGFDAEGESGKLWGAHVLTAYIFLPQ